MRRVSQLMNCTTEVHILEEAGLVAVHQKGREKRYTLTPEPLGDVDEWIKEISAKWDERLLRLKALLENEATGK